VAGAALEAYLIWRSESRTPIVALAAAAGAALALAAIRLLRRWDLPRAAGMAVVAALGGIAGLVVHREWDRVVSALGRDNTLTRRTQMWAIDREFIAQRPWRGFGFEAIWTHQPIIDDVFQRFQAYPYQAHSGYYELLLSVGRVGFALFLGVVAVVLWRAFVVAWDEPGMISLWPAAVAVYLLVTNFSEGLFVSNDIQWVLLVSVACGALPWNRVTAQARAGRASSSR
jgi:O-antigen ligase